MELDLFSPDFLRNPYPYYQRLRDLPVQRSPLGVWLISRHQDVLAVLRGDRVSSQFSRYSAHARQKPGPASQIAEHLLPLLDPPQHTRLRRLVAPLLKDQIMERVLPAIPGLVDELLAGLGSEIELMSQFAAPLPVLVISQLLGIPPADRSRVRGWAHQFFTIFSASRSRLEQERLSQALLEFRAYLEELLERRSAVPEDDLLSLIAGNQELSLDEKCATCVLLFANGEETLGHLIGNSVLALLRHHLWREPAHWKLALEELVRYDTPSQILGRTVVQPLQLGDTTIPAGEPIYLLLGSANRDSQVFEQPDLLNLQRSPNPHLSFGHGTHACMGAFLARREAETALTCLLERFPRLTLQGEPEWRGHPFRRGLTRFVLQTEQGNVPC